MPIHKSPDIKLHQKFANATPVVKKLRIGGVVQTTRASSILPAAKFPARLVVILLACRACVCASGRHKKKATRVKRAAF